MRALVRARVRVCVIMCACVLFGVYIDFFLIMLSSLVCDGIFHGARARVCVCVFVRACVLVFYVKTNYH
jgi:hypothetical protein